MYEFNVNRLIDQLCAANCTNGEMSCEIEMLTKKCEELTKELERCQDDNYGLERRVETYIEALEVSHKRNIERREEIDALHEEIGALKKELEMLRGEKNEIPAET